MSSRTRSGRSLSTASSAPEPVWARPTTPNPVTRSTYAQCSSATRKSHGEKRASVVDNGDVAAVAASHLTHQGEAKPTLLAACCRLAAETLLEDLPIDPFRNAGPGIVNPHHQVIVLLSHRNADPPLAGRCRGRVEGVVDEVAEQRDQVLAVQWALGHDRVIAD